ncbi:MAG: nucleotidyltransferase domain-containing protein [Cyanobacteria bacterium J06623_5]
MVTSYTKKSVPHEYQPYVAHVKQRKAERRSQLKKRHQAGLKKAKELADILKADFGATQVVLFGSMRSVNTIRMKSDIDLAVWNLPFEDHINALTVLMAHASPFEVDLVRIEEASPSLQSHILKNGIALGETVPKTDEFAGDSAPVKNYGALISRIRQSMTDLSGEYQHASHQASLAEETKQDVYWTAVGLSMHGFYTGLEKTFERIADSVDGGLITSQTGQWHKDLPDQMMLGIPGVRPAVIDSETRQCLGQLLSFRHVIRSNYTHRLDPEKIAANFRQLEASYSHITQQLNEFCQFLASVD